jgi:hypothetical protein
MTKERKSFDKRLESLRADRADYVPLWGELSEYHLGYRGRYLSGNGGQRNKIKRNTAQYNNKSKKALRTLEAGMMTGITSPARPWMKLGTGDPDLDDFRTVKEWLFAVERRMYRVFSSSNFYQQMHLVYGQLGGFGTASMGIFDDYDNVIRCETYSLGSYMLGLGGTGRIDTQYREYQKSVGELVKEFGKDNVSQQTLEMWKKGNLEALVECVHAVEPNDDRDMMSPFADQMPWRSVYYEKGARNDEKFLRRSGFKEFPIMAPRWHVDGDDVYGCDCPGITALGDTKALQLGEKRGAQALDKLGNPPLQGSAAVAGKTGNNVPNPGTVTILGTNDKGLESIYKGYAPDLKAIMVWNDRAEARISSAFYEDLFLMMQNDTRNQRATATEVAERHEEKLLVLGPVLERLHAELLNPAVDRTFNIMVSKGVIPPPPKELQGRELVVEYISILAQAQRMVAVMGIERTAGFASSLAQVWPSARFKFNAGEAINEYAHAMGVSPQIIRSDDEADEMAGAEAQQMQQQQQIANTEQMASAANMTASAVVEDPNALPAVLANSGLV